MAIGSGKAGLLGAGTVPGGTQTFNASGTFTAPPGVSKVNLVGKGGPGNAGNSGSAGNPGAGASGGSGGTLTDYLWNNCNGSYNVFIRPGCAVSSGGNGGAGSGSSGNAGTPGNAG